MAVTLPGQTLRAEGEMILDGESGSMPARETPAGLSIAPYVRQMLGREDILEWMMSPAEQAGILHLLQHSQPKVCIEIGTRFGGSLQVLSKFAQRVYALDIDPGVPARLGGRFPNVEYIIGPSQETLPGLLAQLEAENSEVGFVLVDGEHSAEGVRRDIENVLVVRPRTELFIVMHDSFYPDCRRGLRMVEWQANPYVQYVELDFVPGTVNTAPAFIGQLWGGLALACLTPEKRTGELVVKGRADLTFEFALTSPLRAIYRFRRKLLSLRR